jgi:hypothetical protein
MLFTSLDNPSEVSDYSDMEKQPDTELIAQIEAFLAKADMRPTTFGRLAAKDQNLFAQLKDGRELRRHTRERVLSFIGSHSVEAPDVSCLKSNVSDFTPHCQEKRNNAEGGA